MDQTLWSVAVGLRFDLMKSEQVINHWRASNYGGDWLRPGLNAIKAYLIDGSAELPAAVVGQNKKASRPLVVIFQELATQSGKNEYKQWAENAHRIGETLIDRSGNGDEGEKKVLLNLLGTFKQALKIYVDGR